MNTPATKYIVNLAMKLTSKDVMAPKCVRDGLVKPIKKKIVKLEDIE